MNNDIVNEYEYKVNRTMNDSLEVLDGLMRSDYNFSLYREQVVSTMQKLLLYVNLGIPHEHDLLIIHKLNKINFSDPLEVIKKAILESYRKRSKPLKGHI